MNMNVTDVAELYSLTNRQTFIRLLVFLLNRERKTATTTKEEGKIMK